MQTAIDRLGAPYALTISEIIDQADADFALYLRDRKNSRRIPHRLEACGYVAVRNDGSQAGRWKVRGRDVVIYAKSSMSIRDRIGAAKKTGRGVVITPPPARVAREARDLPDVLIFRSSPTVYCERIIL